MGGAPSRIRRLYAGPMAFDPAHLRRLLRESLHAAFGQDALTPEDRRAFRAVARRHAPGPLTRGLTEDLVRTALDLNPELTAGADLSGLVAPMAVQITANPDVRRRLERFWDMLQAADGEGGRR